MPTARGLLYFEMRKKVFQVSYGNNRLHELMSMHVQKNILE